MRLRTFTARSMPAALTLIKQELGEEAIILSSKETSNGIHVTAAIDPDAVKVSTASSFRTIQQAAAPQNARTKESLRADDLRYHVQDVLRFHNIPEFFIAKMLATLTEATTAHILARGRMNIANESEHFLMLALEHIAAHFFQFHTPVTHTERIMLVGAPGVGKTLTTAKLATQYALAQKTPAIITTDVMRAGGVQQLQSFTDILDIEIAVCKNPRELSSLLKQAGKNTPVLIDTAGCNPYDDAEMAELAALCNLSGIEPVLVMPPGTDAQEAIDMAEIFMTLPITRLIATRVDSARRFGGLLSVAAAHKLALSHISASASVAESVKPFTAKLLVDLLLGYRRKNTSSVTIPNRLQSV